MLDLGTKDLFIYLFLIKDDWIWDAIGRFIVKYMRQVSTVDKCEHKDTQMP